MTAAYGGRRSAARSQHAATSKIPFSKHRFLRSSIPRPRIRPPAPTRFESARSADSGRSPRDPAAGDSPWMFAGLLTDEWKSSDTFSQRNETDQRSVQDNNANLDPVLRDLYRVTHERARGDQCAGHVRTDTVGEHRSDVHVDGRRRDVFRGVVLQRGAARRCSTGTPSADSRLTNADLHSSRSRTSTSRSPTRPRPTLRRLGEECRRRRQGPRAHRARQVRGGRRGGRQCSDELPVLATFSLTVGQQSDLVAWPSAERWTVGDSFDVDAASSRTRCRSLRRRIRAFR